MPRDSFERFYLQRVALSEACGCAEAVIRFRDIDDRRAKEGRAPAASRSRGFVSSSGRLLRRPWRTGRTVL